MELPYTEPSPDYDRAETLLERLREEFGEDVAEQQRQWIRDAHAGDFTDLADAEDLDVFDDRDFELLVRLTGRNTKALMQEVAGR